jgi:hypothetical protein
MVEILALVLQHDEQAVLAAVELALEARPLYHHLCWRSMSNTRLLSIIKLSPRFNEDDAKFGITQTDVVNTPRCRIEHHSEGGWEYRQGKRKREDPG